MERYWQRGSGLQLILCYTSVVADIRPPDDGDLEHIEVRCILSSLSFAPGRLVHVIQSRLIVKHVMVVGDDWGKRLC